jgi:hypothetical protein
MVNMTVRSDPKLRIQTLRGDLPTDRYPFVNVAAFYAVRGAA